MPQKLSRKQHPKWPPGFEKPEYDLTNVRQGIVHIGLGGFHRAHMARYTHDLMGIDATALDWGIAGAGLRETDRPLLGALAGQDGLFTLTEREGGAEPALPHIRLDRALQFLIGDRLQ